MNSMRPIDALNVFIVDDSPIIVERLTSQLSDLKKVIVSGHANTISSALNLIETHKPDAVLLDIHLENDAPAATGIDLLAMLRKKYPVMLIMMVTNMPEPQYRDKCAELGADFFFDKTSDMDELMETVQSIAHKTKA
ncbi:MAG: response regulator transcription factor [Bacteroidota bacterium]